MGDGDENRDTVLKELWSKEKKFPRQVRNVPHKDVERKLDINKKLCNIQKILKDNCLGCDIKWSLFVAACNCHSYEESVNPFPTRYFRRNIGKDIGGLLQVIADTPPFTLLQETSEGCVRPIKGSVIDLLHWLLVETSEPAIKLVEPTQIDIVLNCISSQLDIPKPHSIFEVQYSQSSEEEKSWKVIAKRTQSIHLCYGNRLEYFHTVLHKGMKLVGTGTGSKCKDTGVYLSNDICDAIGKSPTGFGWGKSALGSRLCCVAICELADHDQFMCCIKYPGKDTDEISIPTIKHYNVIRPELARIRYLLVYGNLNNYVEDTGPKSEHGLFNWFKRHKVVAVIVGYGLLLVGSAITDLYLL